MPNFTEKYNLKKPLGTENYNVADQNSNMDIIDEELGKQAKQINDLNDNIDMTGWAVEGSKKIISNVLFVDGEYNTGKWGCLIGHTANMPDGVEVGVRETIAYDTKNVTIRITENRPVEGRMWIITYDGNRWTKWSTVAITDKNKVLCTPKKGYVITSQKNYRINNIVYYSLIIKKIDGGNFSCGVYAIANMPGGAFNTETIYDGIAYAYGSGVTQIGMSSFVSNGDIHINLQQSLSNNEIRITGQVVL